MLESKKQRTREMEQEAQNLIGKAYARGLDDAWETARKICVFEQNGGLSSDELVSIFGTRSFNIISKYNAASEAIAKIKAYKEQKKAEEEEIKVGTRVRTTKDIDCNGCNLFPVGTVGVIEEIDILSKLEYKITANGEHWWYSKDMFEVVKDDKILVGDEVIHNVATDCIGVVVQDMLYGNKFQILWNDGCIGAWEKEKIKKTGRHFPQITEILKQLQEGE